MTGRLLVPECPRVLDVAGVIDRQVGVTKRRARGVGAGELLVAMAESMLTGVRAASGATAAIAHVSPTGHPRRRVSYPSRQRNFNHINDS